MEIHCTFLRMAHASASRKDWDLQETTGRCTPTYLLEEAHRQQQTLDAMCISLSRTHTGECGRECVREAVSHEMHFLNATVKPPMSNLFSQNCHSLVIGPSIQKGVKLPSEHPGLNRCQACRKTVGWVASRPFPKEFEGLEFQNHSLSSLQNVRRVQMSQGLGPLVIVLVLVFSISISPSR